MRTTCCIRSIFAGIAALACTAGALQAQLPSIAPTDMSAPETAAASYIVVDVPTGQVLHAKEPDAQRVPASTQKLLTALLVVEAGDLDNIVEIKKEDTLAPPSKIYIKPGESYTRRQLLEALLVKSSNDVALALARDHSGSVSAFAEAMNRRAWELGCRNSHFTNPNGLTEERQYSSARDISFIARAAYARPLIRAIVQTENAEFKFTDGRVKSLKNTNRLLGKADFCDGMKTGFTSAAGFCLVASGKYAGKSQIAVVLGSSKSGIWKDAHQLLAWGLGIREPVETAQNARPAALQQ